MIEWIKTSKRNPGKVALGYWPTVCMMTVAYRDGRYWPIKGIIRPRNRLIGMEPQ